MDTKKALLEYKKKVDSRLNSFFDEKIKQAAKISVSSRRMVERIKEYTMRGGKRLRAALVYYGYACFAEPPQEIIDASMSIELVQSYLLIHDDILDNDDLRRGGPSLHVDYREYCKKRYSADPDHFGVSMAICAGDICSAFGNEVIVQTKFPDNSKVKALLKLNNVIQLVVYGQVLDTLSEVKKKPRTKDVMQIQELKTATYTIEGPLQIGAILAGAGQKDLELLSDFAIPLGVAFQIQDDILGMYGDERKLGKPVDSDLKEGKKTLLILMALDKACKGDKKFLLETLGNPNLTKKDVDKVREIIHDTGSLEYSQKVAKDMIQTAKKVIEQAKFRKQGKDFLLGIADYMLDRDY